MDVGDRREWERILHSPDSTPAERDAARTRLAAADAAIAAHTATVEESIGVDALDPADG